MEELSYTKTNNRRKIVQYKNSKLNDSKKNEREYGISYFDNEKGGVPMDDLLQKYIEKVDRDQSDLRNDLKESERRMNKVVDDSEKRMDARLERIEQMIVGQNAKIETVSDQMSAKLETLSDKVSEKLEDDKKYRHTNNIAIVIGVIATVISMIGIYYATISTVTDILGLTK